MKRTRLILPVLKHVESVVPTRSYIGFHAWLILVSSQAYGYSFLCSAESSAGFVLLWSNLFLCHSAGNLLWQFALDFV